MNIVKRYNCNSIDWQMIVDLLNKSNMKTYTPKLHKKAFENSYRVIFLFDNNNLVGCGRLISDGAYQGALYDIAVDDNYQGNGLGKMIVNELLDGLDDMTILLYAAINKENFYKKLGFSIGKTCMVRFKNPSLMKEKGFI